MAKRPDQKEREKTISETEKIVQAKIAAHKKLGKEFVYDTYGPGVIDEPTWRKIKNV